MTLQNEIQDTLETYVIDSTKKQRQNNIAFPANYNCIIELDIKLLLLV